MGIKRYPLFARRGVMELDGLWDFVFLGDVAVDTVRLETLTYTDRLPVPGAYDAMPAYAGRRGIGVYRTFLELEPGQAGQITFDSVSIWCRVFIDGTAVREHHPAHTRFHCEIPRNSKRRRREVVVVVDNRFDRDRYPLQENFFDFYHYGGILRSVTAYALPDCFITFCHVHIRNATTGEIEIELGIGGEQPDTLDVTLRLLSVDKEECHSKRLKNGRILLPFQIESPKLWSPSSPQLYELQVALPDDAITVRFGLREVRAEKGKILLNGEPIKLLGFCRHEAHPQFGPALPDQQLCADIQLLQDLGCNFVRGSHYPQDQRFLDLCDEQGILVFEESMGWGQKLSHTQDPAFIAAQLQQTEEMIQTSFNHPSVILWGFLNECETSREESRSCFEQIISLIRRLDPSRLVTYASFHGFDDLFLDLVDVVSFNMYPAWYTDGDAPDKLDEVGERLDKTVEGMLSGPLRDKPLLISEIGAGAIYGWHDTLNAFWTEEYQARVLRRVCEEIVARDEICGVAIWQFMDCRTYCTARALGRPRAFNNKGVLDEYRRPKLAYAVVKDVFRPQNK